MLPVVHFKAQYAAHRVLMVMAHFMLLFSLVYLVFYVIPEQRSKAWRLNEQLNLQFKSNKFEYIVDSPSKDFCSNAKVIVLIPSRATFGGLDARLAIRDTWLKSENIPSGYHYKFVIGLPQHESAVRLRKFHRMLKEEQEEFNDLIIYNMPDTYHNLFLKTGVLMQWQQRFCPLAKYLIKADDDTVIDLKRMDKQLNAWFGAETVEHPKIVWGKVLSNSTVIRNKADKWFLPTSKYDRVNYPKYTNGAIYMLTTLAVEAILNVTGMSEDIFLEDVFYTGILREHANVSIVDVETFYPEYWFHEYCEEGIPLLAGLYGVAANSIGPMYQSLISIDCSKPQGNYSNYVYVNRGS